MRYTTEQSTAQCRVLSCPVRDYLIKLFNMSEIELSNKLFFHICDVCPFEEVYNKLAEYEDKDYILLNNKNII